MQAPEAAPTARWEPRELAEAVVLADLTLVLSIASQVLPFGGALLVIAVVPMAAVAARNRLRAVVAGTVAASAVGFLVLGTPVVTSVVGCGALGAVVGYGARRGYGFARTIGIATLFLWPAVSVLVDLLLLVFSDYRKLLLVQVQNAWSGVSHALSNLHVAPLTTLADRGDQFVNDLLRVWWLTIPLLLLVAVVVGAALAQRITGPTLRRVRAAFATEADSLAPTPAPTPTATGERARAQRSSSVPAPVPVALRAVGFRYPGGEADVLHDVSLEIRRRRDGRDRRTERLREVDAGPHPRRTTHRPRAR